MTEPLLQVHDLHTHFTSFGGTRVVKAIDGISFDLREGETLGLIGESGCGKTTTCLSVVGLLPAGQKSSAAPSASPARNSRQRHKRKCATSAAAGSA